MSRKWDSCTTLVVLLCVLIHSAAARGQDPPPIFNDYVPGVCAYYNNCGECNCSPHLGGYGWPCDCNQQQPGWWPYFSYLFYHHESYGACYGFNFDQMPLVDFPNNRFEDGTEPGLEAHYEIRLEPILSDGQNAEALLDRIREVSLECSPDRSPVEAAARYRITLGGWGSGVECDGAVFFLTAEYNPALFDVTLSGYTRAGSNYNANPAINLRPFQSQLIIGERIVSFNELRFEDLIVDPEYIKVSIKPGRSVRDARSQSVKLRAHVFNWGGDTDWFCEGTGNCPEYYVFRQTDAVYTQVFEAELPPNWCREPSPLAPDDALPISTLSEGQQHAAEFDGLGSKLLNDLTADLPTLRVGHNRFRAGRTLVESLGNVAHWHDEFSVAPFVRVSLFGVWCAVDDLPGWESEFDVNELRVIDPCEGLVYYYRNPEGGAIAGGMDLRLEEVTRGGNPVRTYQYSANDIFVSSQTDSDGNVVSYDYQPYGNGTELTVTGTAAGQSREVIARFDENDFLQEASWSGGPARRYVYLVAPDNPALHGRISKVLDAMDNILLEFEYDERGRLIATTRGPMQAEMLNRFVHETPPGNGQTLAETWMVGQCFVDSVLYQATVRRFDTHNRVVEVREYHNLQDAVVPDQFTGEPDFWPPEESFSVTMIHYRDPDEPGEDGVDGKYAIEKELPTGAASEYTLFDQNFNVVHTFTADPGLTSTAEETLIDEKTYAHGQFGGVWQTTSETNVARDATTTYEYDQTSGFLTRRTHPEVWATDNPPIPSQVETFDYDPVNKKLVNTVDYPGSRLDGQENVIYIKNTYDAYGYPSTLTEEGVCGTRKTSVEYDPFGQLVEQADAEGAKTVKIYDDPNHPNDDSGLLLGQYTWRVESLPPGGRFGGFPQPKLVVQQTRYFYFTSGKDQGRLERIEIADHVGAFRPGTPDGWQETTFAYDDYGRVVTKTTTHTARPSESFPWTYAYDLQDRVKQITYPDDGYGTTPRTWVRFTRDGRSRLAMEEVGYGGDFGQGTGGTVELVNGYQYDDNGNLKHRSNQTAADLPDETEYSYDTYNRREQKIDQDDPQNPVGYDIKTHYEYYNNGLDIDREYIREYDGAGNPLRADIVREIDELGRVWRQRIRTIPGGDSALDRITTTTFDVTGSEVKTEVTDTQYGNAVVARSFTCFDYLDGVQRELTPGVFAITDYETDKLGNIKLVIDPVGNQTEYDYSALSLRKASRFYEGSGVDKQLQLRVATHWTSREQRAQETRYDAASTALDRQHWEYGTLGFQTRWARRRDPSSVQPIDTSVDRVINTTHDGVGRLLSRAAYDGAVARTTQWGYDEVGRLETITHPVALNDETLAYWPSTTRLHTRTVVDEGGSRVFLSEFDAFGRLRSETAEGTPDITTSYTYDAASRRTTVTDPNGYVTRYTYDGIGQLTQLDEDDGGIDQRRIIFEFTQKGNLNKVTADDGEGPQLTEYDYDLASRRTKLTHPDLSFVESGYDDAGRMDWRKSEDATETYYTRNWRGQVLTKREQSWNGPILEEFQYDPLSRMTAAGVGPLDTATYKSTFVYGNGTNGPAFVDEPVSVTQVVNGVPKTTTHDYNTAGERAQLGYPADCNETLQYSHDGFGQATAIDRNGGRVANYQYTGRFMTFRQVRTTAGPDEVWVELSVSRPDQLRRPDTITNAVRTGSTNGQGGTVTDSLTFSNVFDAASNLDQQTVSNRPDENGLHDYSYDRLHRLVSVSYPDATSEAWKRYDQTPGLDDLSNWELYIARDDTQSVYIDNVLNQYTLISTGSNDPLHDAKGNLTLNERGYGFVYDFENRLTTVFDDADTDGQLDQGEEVLASFVYDALGRPVHVTGLPYAGPIPPGEGPDLYWYYDGSVPLVEYRSDQSGPVQIYFNGVVGFDEKLIVKNGADEWYCLHKDLDTVAGIAAPDGQLDEWYTYTAYGRPTIHHEHQCPDPPLCPTHLAINNRFYFTGQRLYQIQGEPLIYDYKARNYDPLHGRFQQRDPAEFADTYNLYEYALSRPTVLADPTGEWLGAVAGAFVRGFRFVGSAAPVLAVRAAVVRFATTLTIRAALVTMALSQPGGPGRAAALLQRIQGYFANLMLRVPPRLSSLGSRIQIPQLGNKLDFFLGRASGSAHNIGRAADNLRQLERVGLFDSPETRLRLMEHLLRILNDVTNIASRDGGRVVRESLLMGPNGIIKWITVWEGDKLITGWFVGG